MSELANQFSLCGCGLNEERYNVCLCMHKITHIISHTHAELGIYSSVDDNHLN